MSSSTGAAVTTPPDANARRRNAVTVEKRLVETLGERVISDNGKDLSHTMRGETVLERSKDLAKIRKALIQSSTSPRRRKHLPKPEKPRWQTFTSVLMKNLMLIVVLICLVQIALKLRNGFGNDAGSALVALDYARISRVEDSMKNAAKMLQIQLEIVEKKFGNEIETVANEIGMVAKDLRKFEGKSVIFEKDLKNLELRTDSIEKSLDELKGTGLMSKEELERFWDELKKSESFDGGVNSVHLDHIRLMARGIVEQEIAKHAADGLGRVDYALASGGARVVRHSEPYVYGKANNWLGVVTVAKGRNGIHGNAQKMLEPSFGEPGQCFPLKGSSGFVEIRLRTGIIPEAITLEHVPKSVAYDLSSAPKDCRITGWYMAPGEDPSNTDGKVVHLAEFMYDLGGTNAQTFDVDAADVGVVNMVRLDFESNHGNSALTCIYRLRVHGRDPTPTLA